MKDISIFEAVELADLRIFPNQSRSSKLTKCKKFLYLTNTRKTLKLRIETGNVYPTQASIFL